MTSSFPLRSMAREDLAAAVAAENHGRIAFLDAALLHAGRPDRHSGNRDTSRIRAFGKQAADIGGGDMTLDRIAFHRRSVARSKIVGNAKPPRVGVTSRIDPSLKSFVRVIDQWVQQPHKN